MSYGDRAATGTEQESRVLVALRARGWEAHPFGQGQIPGNCRDILRRYEDSAMNPVLIRWLPDIIAVRDIGKPEVCLIDAKAGGPNFAIETRAVEASEIFVEKMNVPCFFVGDDGSVITPRICRERGRLGPPPRDGRGSGTPYLLIDKQWGRPFADVFGPLPDIAGRQADAA